MNAVFEFMTEGKKYKDEYIPVISRYCVEFIRRYESSVDIFTEKFTEVLQFVGNKHENAIKQIKRPIILLYCEFLLCNIISEENKVGKMIRTFVDVAVEEKVLFISFTMS